MHKKQGKRRANRKLVGNKMGAVRTLRNAPVTPDPRIGVGGGG